MRTIDEIMGEAKSKGFLLSSLFEMRTHPADKHTHIKGTGIFQASFLLLNGHTDVGRGSSISEALEDALKRAKGLSGPENRPIPKEIKTVVERVSEPVDMDDLI